MPITSDKVVISLKETQVSREGEITIVFGKKFRSIDIGLVDSTVFKLRTDPPLQFNWTACCATENAITLRLKFEEP